ncbi:MAG TPA: SBBP repeat-containing protein, partial [Terriglobales bacterium]|nr:SBBP repeat-containing protein [Terriglobales bacterium]
SGLYPGIDVRFYGHDRHVEHDFVLAPGADPQRIVLRFEELDRLELTPAGDAELALGKFRLRETTPVAWQMVNGKTKPIAAQWKLLGENRLGITLGEYDRNLPVTIDPVLVYSTHLGGTTGQDDQGNTFPADTAIRGIGLDGHRNVYVAGSTSATDFPTTAGAFDRAPKMQPEFHVGSFTESGFVSKFDPTGKILIYSTFLRVEVNAMTVDPAGHVYSAEAISEEDLEPSPGFDQGMHVDKLSLDGSKLAFTRVFAATDCQTFANSFPRGMAADNSGHLWLVGATGAPCFPVTSGAFQKTLPNADGSGFVVKFDTNQTPSASVVYSTFMGSSGATSEVDAVAIDSSANAYLAGEMLGGGTFPHGAAFGTGNNSVFVAKLNAAGSALVFGTLLHGAFAPGGIAIDSSHNVYVAGIAETGFHTTTGAFRTSLTGTNCQQVNGPAVPCPEGFVTKLSPGGGTLLYSTFLGGSNNNNSVGGLSLNSAGMAFVAGSTNSADFPTTTNAFKKTLPAGATNAYVEVLQPSGNSLYYSTLLGGSHGTFGGPIFVDPSWNAWVAGNTTDTDYPVTPDAFQPGLKGRSDAFFAKIVIAADLKITMTQSATLVSRGTIVGFTATVSNLGPDGSDAVVLTDTIPAGFSFSSISNSTASSCSVPVAGATTGSVVCHKTRLEKGQSFGVKINLKAIAASGLHITNKVTVSARTQDLNKANNTAQGTVAVQ